MLIQMGSGAKAKPSQWLLAVCAGLGVAACGGDAEPMMINATGVGGQASPGPTTVTTPGPAVSGSPAVTTSPAAGTGATQTAAGVGATNGTAGSAPLAGTGAMAATTAGGGAAGSGSAGTSAMAGTDAAGSLATAGAGGGAAGMPSSAGASGVDAAAGAGGSAGDAAATMHEDLGKGDGKDVVTIGDSWMQLFTSGIEQSLDKVSGQRYRHYAVPGTLVLNEQIPDQFQQAVRENKDIKTVVMTGGGNDILTSSCADEACNPIVDMVSQRLNKLVADEMGMAGVQDVVIIGYTYPSDMSKHASLDHSREISGMTCNPSTMPRCHYVDSSMLQITLQDGIHPNPAGCDLIAKTVFDLMTKEGMRR